jgi:hypothetical protein
MVVPASSVLHKAASAARLHHSHGSPQGWRGVVGCHATPCGVGCRATRHTSNIVLHPAILAAVQGGSIVLPVRARASRHALLGADTQAPHGAWPREQPSHAAQMSLQPCGQA